MPTIDTGIIVSLIAIASAVISLMVALYRFFRRLDHIEETIEKFNKAFNWKISDFDPEDVEKILAQLIKIETIQRKDFETLKNYNRRFYVLAQGLRNVYEHSIHGNHIEEIRESYDKLVDELLALN